MPINRAESPKRDSEQESRSDGVPERFATAAYDYELPESFIAQEPTELREDARLLACLGGEIRDLGIRDFPDLVCEDDLLVLNDTRVLPGRLFGIRAETGGKAEILVLAPTADGRLELMLRTRGKATPGERFLLADGALEIELEEKLGPGVWKARSTPPPPEHTAVLEAHGMMPLPPYIQRDAADPRDRERYQTLFAHNPGAAAAPTAGLHLGKELLSALEAKGIPQARVTLHVGPGTFRPVNDEDLRDHPMHAESWEIPEETVAAVEACRRRNGRVIAIGTTVVRVLESVADEKGRLRSGRGQTRLFIHPPYTYRVVDALFTNFHSPRSTLLMLVAALAGRERVLGAYDHALKSGYRFLSYGDATFWSPPF